MAGISEHPVATCPVHESFDPLSTEFLAGPFVVERELRGYPSLSLPDQTLPFHPNISFRGPQHMFVDTAGDKIRA